MSGARATQVVIPLLCLMTDLVVMLSSVLAAAELRTSLPFLAAAEEVNDLVAILGPLMILGWLISMLSFGAYSPHVMSTGTEEYRAVVNSSLITAGGVGIVCYLAKIPLSRGFFVLVFALGIPLLLTGRWSLRRVVHGWRKRGLLQRRVLVAGDPVHVDEITTVMRRESWLGYRIIGALTPSAEKTHGEQTPLGVTYLGTAGDAADIAQRSRADVLIVASRAFKNSAEMRRVQWALEHLHVQTVLAPNVTDVSAERVTIRPVAGLPLVHLERPQSLEASRWAKRAFDLLVGSAMVVVTSPLMLLGLAAVKLHDRGPVLFRQTRVGRDGVPFSMIKFRSMVVDAEQRLHEVQDLNESDESGVLFKSKEDPRITPPGRWMRRFSIDELPQLFNVLKGDMSLVGPRPALISEVDQYEADVSRRLRVRPGITGLWQVSGRSDLSWDETVRLDLYYVDNWSMVQDLSILVKTLRVVVNSHGAY